MPVGVVCALFHFGNEKAFILELWQCERVEEFVASGGIAGDSVSCTGIRLAGTEQKT